MIINHNIAALNTHRQLATNTANQSKSIEKLSSGLRINRAGDDAAGLSISEKMRGQIRGLDQAARNAQDGISMIQTAEGALNETHSILQRMRELSVQASNDTNTKDDREAMQQEIKQLTSEINRIGNTTEFNTKKLLNGAVNQSAAVSANVSSSAIGSTVKLVTTATAGTATGGTAVSGDVQFHSGKNTTVSGDKVIATDPTVAASGPDVTASNNELTATINGVTKTVVLEVEDYGAGAFTAQDFADDIATKLNAAFGSGTGIKVGFDNDGKLAISTANKADTISLDGGNALSHITSTGLPGALTTTAAQDKNNSLTVTVDGVQKNVTLTAVAAGTGTNSNAVGTYDLSDATDKTDFITNLQTDLDTEFGAGKVTASFDADNKLVLTSASTGAKSSASIDGGAGNALTNLGATTSKASQGLDVNNELKLKVDGEDVTVTLAAGDWNSATLANELQSQINAQTSTAKDVSVTFKDGKLNITSGEKGATGSIEVTDNAFAKAAGLSTGSTKTAGKDEANNDLQFQIGANTGQFMNVNINDMRASALQISSTTESGTVTVKNSDGEDVTASFVATKDVNNGTESAGTEYALDLSTSNKASAAVSVIDKAITSVSSERSKLGAYQNRLEHTINNLNTSSENVTAAESRIRDVDMAKEMMNQTKNSILAQASQAMLAQANQQPQGVLQLLR